MEIVLVKLKKYVFFGLEGYFKIRFPKDVYTFYDTQKILVVAAFCCCFKVIK